MSAVPETYVLYCKELPARRAAAEARMAAAGLRPTWWRGVHAKTWGLATTKTYDRDEVGHVMPPGYAGNLLGHYALWQHLYLTGADEALVFEDDATVGPDFLDRYAAARKTLPRDWQFAFLGVAEDPAAAAAKVYERIPGGWARLVEPYGTHAYLVRGSALPVLLVRMAELRAHADVQLWENVLRGGHVCWYARVPSLVGQSSQGVGDGLWETTLR